MKKLSEIKSDTLLVVNNGGVEGRVMKKKGFLNSSEYLDYDKNDEDTHIDVYIADIEIKQFSFVDVLEQLSEDAYESWKDDVEYNINEIDSEILNLAEKVFQRVLNDFPVFWEGEKIDIDN